MKAHAVLFSMLFLLAAVSAAQTLTPSASSYRVVSASIPSREALITIRKNINEVRLEFTVSDTKGRPVDNMRVSDLQFLEDGKPVTAISEFRSESDLPLRLGLLVDTSASIYDVFGSEKKAALDFLNEVVRPGDDRLMIESFNTKVEIVQPFAADPARAAQALAQVNGSEGLTSFYDAVYAAGETMLAESDNQLMRRAIILISDGEDNYSLHSLRDAIEMAQRANLVVYAISIHAPKVHKRHWRPSGDPEHRGDPIMSLLAEATGGRQYVVEKDTQMHDVFQEIAHELRNMYFVAFPSLYEDGRFHSLQVMTSKELRAHYRSGYWAAER
jgi:Ca-activated chloride channel homolog